MPDCDGGGECGECCGSKQRREEMYSHRSGRDVNAMKLVGGHQPSTKVTRKPSAHISPAKPTLRPSSFLTKPPTSSVNRDASNADNELPTRRLPHCTAPTDTRSILKCLAEGATCNGLRSQRLAGMFHHRDTGTRSSLVTIPKLYYLLFPMSSLFTVLHYASPSFLCFFPYAP